MSFARRCLLGAPIATVLAIVTAAHAQTDYFWNPPTGSTGTWDATNPVWSTVATGPDDYTWSNSGSERANFGNTAGTVALGVPITAYGINFSTANYVISGGGNLLTLSGTGGVISTNVAAKISAQIGGTVGLTKTGSGTLTLDTANTYSGNTTVSGSTLIGTPQTSGSPISSGAVTLNGAILNLKSTTASTTTTAVGNLTVSAANGNTVGASNLIVDNTGGGPSNTTTFAAGSLLRGGSGSALVITPQSGFLGTRENVTFSNGNSLVTNGILPPWVVATVSGSNSAADFVTYSTGSPGDYNHNGVVDAGDYVIWRKDPASNGGAGGYTTWRQNFGNTAGGNGVGVATYSSTDLTTSTNTSVVNQSTLPTIGGAVSAYALKTNQAINLSGNTLTLGNGSGQTGLILNAGSITGGNVSFGNTEGMVFAQGTTTLGGSGNTITSNGLNVTALGLSNVTLGGNIVNGSGSAFLDIAAPTSGSSITLSGTNNYSGGTTLSVNTSTTGNVFVGTDSAFGLGKVTNIIVPGTSSDQLQASGGDRTLANAFDLNGGMVYTGVNSFTFSGPITIINSATGGTRTLQNAIVTAGKSVTLGSGTPSTITLGNPVSNGGDGIGKTLGFSANASSTTIINDVMQDPAAGGGAASGSITIGGSTGGIVQLNSQSTFSGTASLNGASTVLINASSVGSYPSITSGPFGIGTIVSNSGTNNPLKPIGGDRVIANPISLIFGVNISNDASTPNASLKLTGPISLNSTAGRTITNSFTGTGATLTLGDATTPSTISGNPSGLTVQSITFNTGTANINTIVNDAVQESPGSGLATPLTISGAGNDTFNGIISTGGLVTISAGGGTASAPTTTVALNPANTYTGGTALTGAFTILPISGDSVYSGSSITSSPFGTGNITINNGSNQHIRPIGADRTIPNPIVMTTGFAMDNAQGGADQTRNLTFAGPITMTTTGRFVSNGFAIAQPGGTMILGDASSPSTITLPTVTALTLDLAALSGPIVVNDVIQDAAGTSGNVRYNTNANNNSTVTINSQNTFTGTASVGVNGFGNIQLGSSSIGDFGAITSGPFGVGTLVSTNTAATTPAIVPFGADRTVSNFVTLNGNLAAANAGAETFNLNLTGPISLGSVARSIKNNMAGTLTLGQATPAASTNAIMLSGTGGIALTFTGGATSTTAVNDVIQNGGSGIIPGLITVSGGIVQFNNANTYGPSTPGSTTNTTVSGGKLLVNNTSGSGTGTGNVSVTGGILGGNGTISQSVSLSGGAIAPGNGAGTLNVTGGVTFTAGAAALSVEIGGTNPGINYDQLVVGGILDLTAGGTINLSLINAYAPPSSPIGTLTDFTIATAAGGVTGTFSNFSFPDANWNLVYNANSVVARYTAPGPGSGSSLGGGAAVPEPGSLSLLICAAGSALFGSTRRFRRRRG